MAKPHRLFARKKYRALIDCLSNRNPRNASVKPIKTEHCAGRNGVSRMLSLADNVEWKPTASRYVNSLIKVFRRPRMVHKYISGRALWHCSEWQGLSNRSTASLASKSSESWYKLVDRTFHQHRTSCHLSLVCCEEASPVFSKALPSSI